MIKLFRNIRKNLLNEGKTSNYLKYAIGEIVLVAINKKALCPVRDTLLVAEYKKIIQRAFRPACRTGRYEILYNVPNGTLNQRIKFLLPI